jgi:hypothetical protein
MTAEAKPRLKNNHIILYAGENHDFLSKGTTEIRLPSTDIMLLCSRYQKSASDVLPELELSGVLFIEIE